MFVIYPVKIKSHPQADADFADAYDAYADAIFRHCAFRCFNRERARELMQETFIKAWDFLVSGKDIDNVQAFLYKTANNLRLGAQLPGLALATADDELASALIEARIDLASVSRAQELSVSLDLPAGWEVLETDGAIQVAVQTCMA